MAFAALALRLACVLALRGRTFAEGRVSDSQIDPLDVRAKAERQPALSVYSDDFVADQLDGRDMLTGERSLQLTIEIVVADQVEVPTEGDGPPGIAITIPETDEGLELTLNLIERQVLRVVQFDAGPWSEILRALVVRIRKVESVRGAGTKEGVRFAARQLVLTVVPLGEPSFGEPARGTWRKFLDQLLQEADLAPLVPMLEAEILGEAAPPWRVAQGQLGLTLAGVQGMGIAPAFGVEPIEDAPLLSEITIDGDDDLQVLTPEPVPEP